MNRTESPLIRRLRELPIPASDRARAIREFERAERLVNEAAELVAAVRRRLAGDAAAGQPLLRPAAR